MSDELYNKLKRSDNLPSPPSVALRVLELCREDNVSISDVVSALSADPALSMRILKYVNSPIVGRCRNVSSMNQAVTLIGLRGVKMIALSFSLVDPDKQSLACKSFDHKIFWSRSLARGVASGAIARHSKAHAPEEAFMTGLLMGIGQLGLVTADPKGYSRVLKRTASQPSALYDIEREELGISHPEITAHLLSDWQMPEQMCVAIEKMPEISSGMLDSDVSLTQVVYLADLTASILADPPEQTAVKVQEAANMAATVFNIEPDSWATLFGEMQDQWQGYGEMLNVETRVAPSFAEIQAEAVRQMSQLSLAVQLENQAYQQRQDELLHQATTDRLTGVNNRAAFDERLNSELDRTRRTTRPISLLMIDVDHFKQFNDTHGHQAGDEVLKAVGASLANTARTMDSVSRYGGEEFVIIAPECSPENGLQLAERVRATISQITIPWEGAMLHVTASVGGAFARWPERPRSAEELIKAADDHLYKAKDAGRNRACFEPSTEASAAAAG